MTGTVLYIFHSFADYLFLISFLNLFLYMTIADYVDMNYINYFSVTCADIVNNSIRSWSL